MTIETKAVLSEKFNLLVCQTTAEQHTGLDWAEREPLQAAMRVALRRTLVRFGFEKDRAENTAGDLVSWFKTHATGLTNTEPT
jgi:hypothetical protein